MGPTLLIYENCPSFHISIVSMKIFSCDRSSLFSIIFFPSPKIFSSNASSYFKWKEICNPAPTKQVFSVLFHKLKITH